jgi:hypothetical protein
MEKEFVPYQPSFDMKELGFDEPCLATYHKELHTIIPIYAEYTNQDVIKAPLYQQAFRWFREKYGLHSTIHLNSKGYFTTITKKIDTLTPCIFSSEIFNSPEEAELECLKKLIEIVKNNSNDDLISGDIQGY